jgi:hypothetical protein
MRSWRRRNARNRRAHSAVDPLVRRVEITDAETGRVYTAIDRVKGVIATDALTIHSGLPGFLGPEMVPPTVQLVARRQVIRKADRDARLEEEK